MDHPTTTNTPVEMLKLTPRVYNALIREGIDSVEKLRQVENPRLFRGIDRKGGQEIDAALAGFQGPTRQAAIPTPEEDEAAPTEPEPAPAARPETPPAVELPYPDLKEDDPQETFKLLANTLAERLAQHAIPPEKRAEAEKKLIEFKEMADAPEGYYPWSYVQNCNPLNQLTHGEKLTCIRTLPLPIVIKLFPHL